MRMSIALNLTNFVLFQGVWFITVMGAANGLTWPGLAALFVFLTVQTTLAANPRRDYVLCAVLLAVGAMVETANAVTGLIDYRGAFSDGALPPLWIFILWCDLGLIINHSVACLQTRPALAAVLGSIGGAMSYAGGVALGAADFGIPTGAAIGIIALTWAIITPLIMITAHRLNGGFRFRRVA